MATEKVATNEPLDEILLDLDRRQMRKDLPDFKAGDTVRVHVKIREGDKERVQVFQGAVIRRKGAANRATFTVRKISYGVGVERTFPLHSPLVDKIELVRSGRVRRGKIYYIRGLRGKAARIREKKRRRVEVTEDGAPETVEPVEAEAATGSPSAPKEGAKE